MSCTTAKQTQEKRTVADQAHELQLVLNDVIRHHQFRDVDQVCEYGITITECHALELIALHGPLSVKELAARIHLNKSTVSRAAAALTEKGLIRRGDDPDDARAWRLAPTTAGRKLYDKISASSLCCYTQLLADFDPAVREGVIEVLRRLSATIACRG